MMAFRNALPLICPSGSEEAICAICGCADRDELAGIQVERAFVFFAFPWQVVNWSAYILLWDGFNFNFKSNHLVSFLLVGMFDGTMSEACLIGSFATSPKNLEALQPCPEQEAPAMCLSLAPRCTGFPAGSASLAGCYALRATQRLPRRAEQG